MDLIELELAELIQNGSLKAKINSFKKLLHMNQDSSQLEAYKEAVKAGNQFINNTEDMLLKISLLRNDQILSIKDKRKMENINSAA